MFDRLRGLTVSVAGIVHVVCTQIGSLDGQCCMRSLGSGMNRCHVWPGSRIDRRSSDRKGLHVLTHELTVSSKSHHVRDGLRYRDVPYISPPGAYIYTGKINSLRYDFGTPISKWYHIYIVPYCTVHVPVLRHVRRTSTMNVSTAVQHVPH